MEHILSYEEAQSLIIALARGMEQFTEADAQLVINEAVKARIGVGLFDLAISGDMVVVVSDGEVKFRTRE